MSLFDPFSLLRDRRKPASSGIKNATVAVLPSGSTPTASVSGDMLHLGIPAASQDAPTTAPITTVQVTGLAAGAQPTATMSGTTLVLGIPAGQPGASITGPAGVTSTTATALPAGSVPTVSLSGGVLTLGIPAGQPGAAAGATVVEYGSAAIAALVLNSQTDVTVTLSAAMPSAVYTVRPALLGVAVGNATLTVKSQTTTQVVVTVKANVALAASTLFLLART